MFASRSNCSGANSRPELARTMADEEDEDNNEVPHRNYVRVVDMGATQYLLHSGTGEIVALPRGRWRLFFDTDGFGGVTTEDNTEGRWCVDLFSKGLYTGLRAGDEKPQQFVSKDGQSTWLADLRDRVVSRPFSHKVGDLHWKAETYRHDLPTGSPSSPRRLWWCLPWWVTALFGQDYSNKSGNFIGKSVASFRGVLSNSLDFESGALMMRNSVKATIAQNKARGRSIEPSVALSAEAEFSMDTAALVALSAWMSASSRFQTDKTAARRILVVVVDKFMQGRDAQLSHPDYGELRIASGMVDLSILKEFETRYRSQPFQTIFKDDGDAVPVSDFLVKCIDNLLQRRTEMWRCKLKSAVRGVCALIADAAECSLIEEWWDRADHLMLDPLVSPNKKARRVPQGYKMALQSSLDRSKGVRQVGQLIAADGILSKKRNLEQNQDDGSHALSHNNGDRFVAVNSYQYWLEGRSLASRTRNVGISLDGTHCSGEDVYSYSYWSHQAQQGMWLPTQVDFIGK